ncbi:isochorismatase family protein [Nocardia sp. NPDC051030]|uniref:isochorismatase family protein n=1 Tax=Nocardia sp. NPDC051030 TaxID=3155162 RepID=UPI0034464367
MDDVSKGENGELATALVVVDMQQGFLEGAAAVPEADRLVAAVSGLLREAREAGALVIHLQNDGPVGEADEPGQPGWELPLAIPGEAIVRKSSDDGFEEPELGGLLEKHNVRRLVIGGLLSEMCVSATARTALERGLCVVLPRDAHATYDLEDIPAAVVSRVAEHTLGDEIELAASGSLIEFGGAA